MSVTPSPIQSAIWRWCSVLVAVLAATMAAVAHADGGRTPKPAVTIANPGQCIAPVDEMRRNHMDMLKHQRDRTLRQGIRGEKASLNACIECHAGKSTGSVLGKDGFCESCHAYAAVKLDCWDCHQPKANYRPAVGVKP